MPTTSGADAVADSYLRDEDLQAKVPTRPRGVSELIVLTAKADEIVFVGGGKRVQLEGRHAVPVIRDLWPLLDGRRSLEQLAELLPSFRNHLESAIALLHRHALIEEGDAPSGLRNAALDSFIGRHVSAGGFFDSRAVAAAAVRTARVHVQCPEPLRDDLVHALQAYEFAAITAGDRATDLDAATHGLIVSSGEHERFDVRIGRPTLYVRLGDRKLGIGPVLGGKREPCPDCIRKNLQEDAGSGEAPDPTISAAFIALHLFGLISRTAPQPLATASSTLWREGDEWIQRSVGQPRRPGCRGCGLENEQDIASSETKWTAWKALSATFLPPHDFLSNRTHEGHYKASNIALADAADDAVDGDAVRFPIEGPHGDLHALEDCLRTGFGFSAGTKRKIAPTGGSLRSPEAYLVWRGGGIRGGIYRYHAQRHDLIRLEKQAHRFSALQATFPRAGSRNLVFVTSRVGRLLPKYHKYSERIGLLDAGVASAFMKCQAQHRGLQVEQVVLDDYSGLSKALGFASTFESHEGAALFAISPRNGSSLADDSSGTRRVTIGQDWTPPIAKRTNVPLFAKPLHDILTQRRATRRFDASVVGDQTADRLLSRSWTYLRRSYARRELQLGLLMARRELNGEYAVRIAAEDHDDLIAGERLPADSFRHAFNQVTVGGAPLLLFAVGNVPAALAAGRNGIREMIVAAGDVLGYAWLAAVDEGLVGTLSGGALYADISEALGLDGYRRTVLFTLAAGLP